MEFLNLIVIILGLSLFEIIASIDNAIINAEVLRTMGARARRWFLVWGLLFAVFIVRGVLPWLIVWLSVPQIGFFEAFTATLKSDQKVIMAIERASPMMLMGGGTFMVFLFFHWLFMEPKNYGLPGEKFFHAMGVWFYAVVSVLLATIVWFALKADPLIAFGAVVGSTVFFITHGFKQNAEAEEVRLLEKGRSDISKILYLEVIDATFSIDGVLGAFAFTLSVPLILLGNGIGAIVLRQFTISNIDRIKKYLYLRNGAMYSVLFLGSIMVAEGFGYHAPVWLSPSVTALVVGYFFLKSKHALTVPFA